MLRFILMLAALIGFGCAFLMAFVIATTPQGVAIAAFAASASFGLGLAATKEDL